jgi:isopentenyl diphosphate isomerase/L-lactate dehydrogenase-like FMN-dependent dehydrogenase
MEMEKEGKKAMKKLAAARAKLMAKSRARSQKAEEAMAKPGYKQKHFITNNKNYKGPKPLTFRQIEKIEKARKKAV